VPYITLWQRIATLAKSNGEDDIPQIVTSLEILAKRGIRTAPEVKALLRLATTFGFPALEPHLDRIVELIITPCVFTDIQEFLDFLNNCRHGFASVRAELPDRIALEREIERIESLPIVLSPLEFTTLVNFCWAAFTDGTIDSSILSKGVELITKGDLPGEVGKIACNLDALLLNNETYERVGIDLMRWCCHHNADFRLNFARSLHFVFSRIRNEITERIFRILADCLIQIRDPKIVEALLEYPKRNANAEPRVTAFLNIFATKSRVGSDWLVDVFRAIESGTTVEGSIL
jgi:hypothetical protein